MGKLAIFIGGLFLGAVGAFVGLVYLEMHQPRPDHQIVFAPKNFFDNKQSDELGLVAISGTLTYQGMEGVLHIICRANWTQPNRQNSRPVFISDSEMDGLRGHCAGRAKPAWMLPGDNYH